MVSNTRDMIRFMQALLSGKLLGEDSLAQMKAFHKCELLGGIVDYGLGLMEYGTALGPAYGHGGLNFGYESNTMVVPGKGISLSHMHNLLPEQSWALAAGALDLLSAGPPETTAPACVPPEGFLDGDGGPHLEFRYSGVVSADTDPLPAPGMVHAVAAFVEDSHVPLYGLASTALLKKSAFQTRVDFQTVGPGADPEYPLVAASVSATTALLASDGTDTELDLATMPAYTLFAATVKIRIDPVTSKADRFCFTGVPQAQSPGRLFRCGTSAGKVEVGQRVKLFASVPLTSDPLAIADYVDVLKMAVCMCIQDNGTWAVCTD
ncbi:MAG: beta-lactamase family protein [Deltaproteobacteria bacterium]|nr:beta-lactamase family protein [Deltaproteobacteria bacterium]